MKNAEIIKALPKLKALHSERKTQQYAIKALEAQLTGMRKQLTQLEYEIKEIESVTEVFEGIALRCNQKQFDNGPAFDVHAVDHELRRYAEVYPNAHNKGADWGLRLREFNQGNGRDRDDFQGCGWAFADAVLTARRWAAHGTRPTKEFETMCKLRHKLDPLGAATKKRVAAFEAACMAGHHELAAELLVGAAKAAKHLPLEQELPF